MLDKKYIAVIVLVLILVAYFYFKSKKPEKLKSKKSKAASNTNASRGSQQSDSVDESDDNVSDDEEDDGNDEEPDDQSIKHNAEVLYKTIHSKMASGMTNPEFNKLAPQYAKGFVYAELKQIYNKARNSGKNPLTEVQQSDYELIIKREG